MKIAVIGGAGVRTPLLVGGLTGSDLPIDEIALYDIDQDRLSTIGGVAARMAVQGRVVLSASLDACVTGADFVFTSIRVGGLAHRVRDETIALSHGIVGQETVGPAGFAMAARTIPQMVQYARAIARTAPSAWIINFTNPVGMITEAMRTVTSRVIGICDTPTELFEEVAHALDLRSDHSFFDYFGLNHLGWIREVYSDGVPQLRRLWADRERLHSLYKVPLFDPAYLRDLKLLPTEYVYYYHDPQRALTNLRQVGQTRGQAIAELTDVLFDALRNSKADSVAIYRSYLFARSASYMQIESGAAPAVARVAAASQLSGYDKIALAVVRAIHLNLNAIIPLSVENCGNIPSLMDRDVVEVPCVVNANGARPLHVGRIPDRIQPLLAQVKEYERLTVRAVLAQSVGAAREALAHNPLIPDRVTADRLVHDLSPLW